MSEIKELKDKIDSIREDILASKKLKGDKKQELVEKIEKNIKSAKKLFNQVNNDSKLWDDDDERKLEFDSEKKLLKNEISKLNQNLETIKTNNKEALLADAEKPEETAAKKAKEEKENKKKAGTPGSTEVATPDSKREERKKIRDAEMEKDLFKDVFNLQDESMQIVERLLAKATVIKQDALDINDMLMKQKEQLQVCDQQLDKINTASKMAKREMISFMRKVVRTKILLVVIILLLILALVLVGLAALYIALKVTGVLAEIEKFFGITSGISSWFNFTSITIGLEYSPKTTPYPIRLIPI